jgi:hypothetical protein
MMKGNNKMGDVAELELVRSMRRKSTRIILFVKQYSRIPGVLRVLKPSLIRTNGLSLAPYLV